MPNYQDSKIYKIYCPAFPDEIYIGSTTNKYLCNRMSQHCTDYRNREKRSYTRSHDLFDKHGLENCIIELIKVFPCATRAELEAEEAKYLKVEPVVNHNIPQQDPVEYQKAYHEKNKEHRLAQMREYNRVHGKEIYEARKDSIKEWKVANREHQNELQRIRRAKAKEAKE